MENHGESRTRLYKIWADMKARCYTSSCRSYVRYGALGITVCDDWKESYTSFSSWARRNGYNDSLTIERKNVYGNYEPDNCTFIPWEEQYENRKCNKKFKAISPEGVVFYAKHIKKFSEEHQLHKTMVARVLAGQRKKHRGWQFEYEKE